MSKQKIKVLVIADYLGRSNLNPVRPEAAQLFGLQQSGEADISVLCSPESVLVDYYRDNGLTVIPHKIDGKLSLKSIRFIRKLIRDQGFELLHLFNSRAISNGATAAIGLPVKVIAYRGQTGSIKRYDPSSYLNMLHPRIDKIVCVAKAVELDLRKHLWGNKDKLITIYKGHSLDWYQAPKADLSALNLPDDAFTLSLVANLRPRKGLHVLMEATHHFPKDAPIYTLLVGANPDDPKVKEMAAKAVDPSKVIALGYRNDAPQVSGASDIIVLPTTKREGLSRAILEGMAYGRAAVVTSTGGNAELVKDGESGYVVDPSDAPALGKAITRLWQDRDQTDAFGANARQRIEAIFNVQQGIDKHLQLYKQLTGRL
ncbi:glycosyltransferase family 4 protein [Ferrimonas sp. SCSIO 43195]|uniref:glycosyltransferase family 4 protein n=1 Tax=Ferrimonas sp. SCSIO 43195 TaxID=2822844 RepID=UPI0020758936|nr:glycosyltransferase family 4 protein [Ferrimonas sp. SCSIO 43195]USD37749.1 glycosyltransferase family 4 protein [Ferrimonas sp. SCSIO 43195]